MTQSRLFHLGGRVDRLKKVAPNHAAIDRLISKVSEAGGHVAAGPDSFGSGEKGSFINEENLTDAL